MRIVYHSFEGRYSDNPRALYEALLRRGGGAHEHVWLADPAHLDAFPVGVMTVPYGGADCIAVLESADVVVANTHTDLPWTKRPDATYLQTWHGTPLKRIHWDVLWAPEGRLERLQGDVDQWDVLVSPNRFATEAMRGAFRFTGEVLEAGYPRNDRLLAADRDEVRARVRRALAIPDGATAVLYTPTWRDDFVFGGGTDALELRLDAAAFDARLGADHVLLLRTHYMLTGRLDDAVGHPSVRDVSAHPEVSELYLAADVLVTDYSSTMFDFAVTGRPQVFFAYDLDHYRSQQRGFYFDFEPVAPGPIVETTEHLLDALEDLEAVRQRYAGRYAAFRERFTPLEDGRAAERVLERLGLIAPTTA